MSVVTIDFNKTYKPFKDRLVLFEGQIRVSALRCDAKVAPKTIRRKMEKMNLLIDIDGVMTTGQFLYSPKGKAFKVFGPHDADGLKIVRDKMNIVFCTADKRGFSISKRRIDDMGYKIELIEDGTRYEYIKDKYGFENTIFIGDGIFDAPIIRDCKFGIAPANARIEARKWAKYVTPSKSGEGAVCDACIAINKRFFKA